MIVVKLMARNEDSYPVKLRRNWRWLIRYPFSRAAAFAERTAFEKKRLIVTIADHFEPGWSEDGILGIDDQRRRLDWFWKEARRTGEAVRDSDGTRFRHTYFYPGEQYDRGLLDTMAAIQAEGLGETEVHLHHGVTEPDTSENLRRTLTEFRDRLAGDHGLLSRLDGAGGPRWAFVHGNLALANSHDGLFCGVDDEMAILEETGCYADFTLPSAPDRSQVPIINRIYECGLPHGVRAPHRRGRRIEAGRRDFRFPIIFQGPLVFNWTRSLRGIPFPRLEDGALVFNQPMDIARVRRWIGANVTVKGRSDWIFIKLYCHGFFNHDEGAVIGEDVRVFFDKIIEHGDRTGEYTVHFASAREAVNMVFAAVDGLPGEPGRYRDYRLRTIMSEKSSGRKLESGRL